MKDKELDYININKASWNSRTAVHYESDFYNNKAFIAGQSSLNPIELALLPDLEGKSVLHLQCHFGQDTISFGRLGADVVGVDLSDQSIAKAQELAKLTNSAAEFICCNVYDLPKYLDRQFDVVFTSYGVIGWLPDLNKWAALIAQYLKPNGQLIFVEFHPVVWMFDDNFEKIKYSYFNTGAIVESESGTYANKEAPISQDYVMWNHSMSDVVNNLIKHGLVIQNLQEYNYSPYNCFQQTIEFAPKQYRIEHLNDYLPMVYSITAKKTTI